MNPFRTIAEAIEAAAPELIAKLEEADRQAEIRHQQWLVRKAAGGGKRPPMH